MGMPDAVEASLRVAIIANTARQRLNLKTILEANNMRVVDDGVFHQSLGTDVSAVADVLLVDLDETVESNDGVLEQIVSQVDLPVLYNDSAGTRNHFSAGGVAWGRRLADKLIELVNTRSGKRVVATISEELAANDAVQQAVQTSEAVSGNGRIAVKEEHLDFSETTMAEFDAMVAEHITTIEEALKALDEEDDDDIDLGKYERKIAEYRDKQPSTEEVAERPDFECNANVISAQEVAAPEQPVTSSARTRPVIHKTELDPLAADRIWVLGASIGGPQAVEEFLMTLPAELKCAFVLAQHIGPGFVPLLAEQLDRKCKLKVSGPVSGRLLKNSQVVVSPVHQRIVFDRTGHVILKPIVEKTTYSPSIDAVLTEVANRFGPRAGAIIFSGMGNDGMKGVEALTSKGGTVWAQSADSCVVSAMADCARRTGGVEYSGTPTQLARRLTAYLQKHP